MIKQIKILSGLIFTKRMKYFNSEDDKFRCHRIQLKPGYTFVFTWTESMPLRLRLKLARICGRPDDACRLLQQMTDVGNIDIIAHYPYTYKFRSFDVFKQAVYFFQPSIKISRRQLEKVLQEDS